MLIELLTDCLLSAAASSVPLDVLNKVENLLAVLL